MKSYFLSIVLMFLLLYSCKEKENVQVRFDKVQGYVVAQLESARELLKQVREIKQPKERIDAFKNARIAFKKAEPFASIVSFDNTHRLNGPPLPVFREDNSKVLSPIGLQAIEETIYEDSVDERLLSYQIDATIGHMNEVINSANKFGTNPRRFFPAIHQQFLRIFSLGITGFDTPTSLAGLEESAASLESIKEIYQMSIGDTIQFLNSELHNSFLKNLEDAKRYLEENTDFDSFDRYVYGREHINSLTKDWVVIQDTFGFKDPGIYALNLDAESLFDADAFNPDFFRPSVNRNPSKAQIELGRALFADPRLSGTGNLSCQSCHKPELAFQDGYTKGLDKEGKEVKRNTPTLTNVLYQKKFFWDGRADNLEAQITNVFNNENEFDQNAHAFETNTILADTLYEKIFKEVYPRYGLKRVSIIRALSSYVSTLNAMNSRFDQNMRGELNDFTKEEVLGMNLFMGKALCATCHFMPLTNGTVPPIFNETEKEILGTPKTADNKEVDDDLGFYWRFKVDIHKYMFKTPTVRNIELTAPYMHNGVYDNLEQVMDFYNKGGGAGIGFDLPHQTLPFDSLNLSKKEQQAIIAFMKTLTDEIEEDEETL